MRGEDRNGDPGKAVERYFKTAEMYLIHVTTPNKQVIQAHGPHNTSKIRTIVARNSLKTACDRKMGQKGALLVSNADGRRAPRFESRGISMRRVN